MKGLVFVAPEGYDSQADLDGWVERCVKFISTLPPRTAGRTTR